MSVNGIGGAGAPSALYALRLALRQARVGGGAVGATEASAGTSAAALTPDALMSEIVGRAQFQASVRIAAAAVEQVDATVRTFYPPAG